MNCYICGSPNAQNPLRLADTFTAHASCRSPQSDKICDRCNITLDGREKMLWYWHPQKLKWSRIWGRSLSRLYQGDTLLAPVISDETHTEGKITAPILKNFATRAEIRDWILNPPAPPFRIIIAESGQKHITFWAQTGLDRERFPVQFELDCLWIDRAKFGVTLGHFEALMGLGFSKGEIVTGEYQSDRLMAAIAQYAEHDQGIMPHRGSRILALINHLAIHPYP